MTRWLPLVNPKVAEEFKKLGYVEDRDFRVSPYLPDDYVVEVNLDEYPEFEPDE